VQERLIGSVLVRPGWIDLSLVQGLARLLLARSGHAGAAAQRLLLGYRTYRTGCLLSTRPKRAAAPLFTGEGLIMSVYKADRRRRLADRTFASSVVLLYVSMVLFAAGGRKQIG
jgi:hypothetical protein